MKEKRHEKWKAVAYLEKNVDVQLSFTRAHSKGLS